MKKFLLLLLVLILLAGAWFLNFKNNLMTDLNSLSFAEVSPQNAANGIYVGSSTIGPVSVDAEVRVKDGKIQSVRLLKHQNGMGRSAESLPTIMVVRNTWDVDCVTGATISSQAIRQAVNRALEKACQ